MDGGKWVRVEVKCTGESIRPCGMCCREPCCPLDWKMNLHMWHVLLHTYYLKWWHERGHSHTWQHSVTMKTKRTKKYMTLCNSVRYPASLVSGKLVPFKFLLTLIYCASSWLSCRLVWEVSFQLISGMVIWFSVNQLFMKAAYTTVAFEPRALSWLCYATVCWLFRGCSCKREWISYKSSKAKSMMVTTTLLFLIIVAQR